MSWLKTWLENKANNSGKNNNQDQIYSCWNLVSVKFFLALIFLRKWLSLLSVQLINCFALVFVFLFLTKTGGSRAWVKLAALCQAGFPLWSYSELSGSHMTGTAGPNRRRERSNQFPPLPALKFPMTQKQRKEKRRNIGALRACQTWAYLPSVRGH